MATAAREEWQNVRHSPEACGADRGESGCSPAAHRGPPVNSVKFSGIYKRLQILSIIKKYPPFSYLLFLSFWHFLVFREKKKKKEGEVVQHLGSLHISNFDLCFNQSQAFFLFCFPPETNNHAMSQTPHSFTHFLWQ